MGRTKRTEGREQGDGKAGTIPITAPVTAPVTAPAQVVHRDNRGRRSSVRPDLYLEGLAKDVGISAGYLSKLLRGIGKPSVPVAMQLSKAMGMTVEQLIETLKKAKAEGKGERGEGKEEGRVEGRVGKGRRRYRAPGFVRR